jgi:hypothetical protein
MVLGAINVMTLWYLGVLAIGLGKLSRRSALVPALSLYGIWVLFQMAVITLALFTQRLRSGMN